jgi:hypothetical protein
MTKRGSTRSVNRTRLVAKGYGCNDLNDFAALF